MGLVESRKHAHPANVLSKEQGWALCPIERNRCASLHGSSGVLALSRENFAGSTFQDFGLLIDLGPRSKDAARGSWHRY